MTQSEKYIEGQWYGWNGGECPVHPETVVDLVFLATNESCPTLYDNVTAVPWPWSDESEPIIAFRVVKHHVEPRVVWVNEYDDDDFCGAHKTKDEAIKYATKDTTRIAVRYVEAPE